MPGRAGYPRPCSPWPRCRRCPPDQPATTGVASGWVVQVWPFQPSPSSRMLFLLYEKPSATQAVDEVQDTPRGQGAAQQGAGGGGGRGLHGPRGAVPPLGQGLGVLAAAGAGQPGRGALRPAGAGHPVQVCSAETGWLAAAAVRACGAHRAGSRRRGPAPADQPPQGGAAQPGRSAAGRRCWWPPRTCRRGRSWPHGPRVPPRPRPPVPPPYRADHDHGRDPCAFNSTCPAMPSSVGSGPPESLQTQSKTPKPARRLAAGRTSSARPRDSGAVPALIPAAGSGRRRDAARCGPAPSGCSSGHCPRTLGTSSYSSVGCRRGHVAHLLIAARSAMIMGPGWRGVRWQPARPGSGRAWGRMRRFWWSCGSWLAWC